MALEVRSLAEWDADGVVGLLSVVIPAHNEEDHIPSTVRDLHTTLTAANIAHEILVVNDNSRDATEDVLKRLTAEIPTLRYINNTPPNGFGFAVRAGLSAFKGGAVAIVMADGSDAPADLVAYWRKLQEGYDCAFGSRFVRGATTTDYPLPKLLMNRLANFFIRTLFWMSYNDVTNAFKLYRRSVIAGVQPLLALPLQPDAGASAQIHRPGLSVRGGADLLGQSNARGFQVQAQGHGLALSFHRLVLLPREVPVAGGLPEPHRSLRQTAAGVVTVTRQG